MAQSRGSSRGSRSPSVSSSEDESLAPLPCTEEPCWDEGELSEDIVKEHVYRVNTNPGESDVTFIPKDEQCGIWHSPPNAKCHASFGDQGTTATVGAFGQLVQFSDYLGAGTSGMFSADHPETTEPYLVRVRMTDLQDLVQEPFQLSPGVHLNRPFGLEFPGLKLKPDMLPVLKWVNWRWPRYEYSTGAFQDSEQLDLTIQCMVHDKVVLQRYRLENHGPNDIDVDLGICKRMRIRDLEHLNDSYGFNEGNLQDNYHLRPGPKGYSWTCVHVFHSLPTAAGQEQEQIDTADDSGTRGNILAGVPVDNQNQEGKSGVPLEPPGASEANPVEVSTNHHVPHHDNLKDSPSENQFGQNPSSPPDTKHCVAGNTSSGGGAGHMGLPRLPSSGSQSGNNKKEKPYGVVIIMSVITDGTMRSFESDTAPQRWTQRLESRASNGGGSPIAEVTIAYKMVLLNEKTSNWENPIITAAEMRLDTFLKRESPSCFLPLSTTVAGDERQRDEGPERHPTSVSTTSERSKSIAEFPSGVPAPYLYHA